MLNRTGWEPCNNCLVQRNHRRIFKKGSIPTEFVRHGDINKPNRNPRGRIQAMQNWEALANLLNADPTGEAKTTERWKKVWSDLKNNTKKKAAKINRASCGTGGGPALHTKLTELEQRVLNILGHQVATGLVDVVESGISQVQADVDVDRTVTLTPTPPILTSYLPIRESPTIFTFPANENAENVLCATVWDEPGPSRQPHIPPPSPRPSPARECPARPHTPNPAHMGHTPSSRRCLTSRRLISSPRRRVVRPHLHVDHVAQQFLNSDEMWKNFLQKKHDEEMALERDKMRARERDQELQERWQEIAGLAISALNNIIDYYCKK